MLLHFYRWTGEIQQYNRHTYIKYVVLHLAILLYSDVLVTGSDNNYDIICVIIILIILTTTTVEMICRMDYLEPQWPPFWFTFIHFVVVMITVVTTATAWFIRVFLL